MMTLKESYIVISRQRVHAHIGVSEEEREEGCELSVSLRIGFDISKAMVSDDVRDTLDYSALTHYIDEYLTYGPIKTLEGAAGPLLKSLPNICLDTFGQVIKSADLKIYKIDPPTDCPCERAGIELHAEY